MVDSNFKVDSFRRVAISGRHHPETDEIVIWHHFYILWNIIHPQSQVNHLVWYRSVSICQVQPNDVEV